MARLARLGLLAVLTAAWLAGCADEEPPREGEPGDGDVAQPDGEDGGAGDSGSPLDAAAADLAADAVDSSPGDAGPVDTSDTADDTSRDAPEADSAADSAGDSGEDAEPDYGPVDVTPVATDAAVVVGAVLPIRLDCGADFEASVTMRNTGSATWTRAGGYKLGMVDDSDPFRSGDTRIWLAAEDSVPTGYSHTFTFTLTAPDRPGTYLTDWQMVHEGVRWFGEVASSEVAVECELPDVIDASTLTGKLMLGYQGWFATPGDSDPPDHVGPNRWVHWAAGVPPAPDTVTFDLWPDLSEYGDDELAPAPALTFGDGSTARLYSNNHPEVVRRHVRWMRDYGIDGVFLQRFVSELGDPVFRAWRDSVAEYLMAASEEYGRVFVIMYDISGKDVATLFDDITNDWKHLVDDVGVTDSDRYLHHDGRPLLAIWGIGFAGRDLTPTDAQALIDWFTEDAAETYRVTLMGGVPTHWRTCTGDADPDPYDCEDWSPVYRSLDVISPWTVGRYGDESGAASYRDNVLEGDLIAAASAGADFLPVVFPGFSWFNLRQVFPDGNSHPINAIPREGGHFFWRQVYEAADAGCDMLYVAMFDEVDEGTAMYKLAPTAADAPTNGTFLTLDADGHDLPSDHYLYLTGQASRMLRGDIPLSTTWPTRE